LKASITGFSKLPQLPHPHLLIAPCLRREAVLSSRIEGTQASLAVLLTEEAGQLPSVPADDVPDVRNYVTALEYGIGRLDSLPLSLRLVRELHAKLLAGVRGETATPGEFRRSQNWIGPPGSTWLGDAKALKAATRVPYRLRQAMYGP
jgi:Fic family protein